MRYIAEAHLVPLPRTGQAVEQSAIVREWATRGSPGHAAPKVQLHRAKPGAPAEGMEAPRLPMSQADHESGRTCNLDEAMRRRGPAYVLLRASGHVWRDKGWPFTVRLAASRELFAMAPTGEAK